MRSVSPPDGVSFTAPYHELFILNPFMVVIHSEAEYLMLLLANCSLQVAEVCTPVQMVSTRITVSLIRCYKTCCKFVWFF